MAPAEAREFADLLSNGGYLILFGWAMATARAAYTKWASLAEQQEKLIQAQLAALGEKPEQVLEDRAESVKLLREIRDSLAA